MLLQLWEREVICKLRLQENLFRTKLFEEIERTSTIPGSDLAHLHVAMESLGTLIPS